MSTAKTWSTSTRRSGMPMLGSATIALVLTAFTAQAQQPAATHGWTPIFDGKSLNGWTGSAQFGISGPIRYTCNARSASRLFQSLGAEALYPIHFEGWTHFKESRAAAEAEFLRTGHEKKVRWLNPGERTEIEA